MWDKKKWFLLICMKIVRKQHLGITIHEDFQKLFQTKWSLVHLYDCFQFNSGKWEKKWAWAPLASVYFELCQRTHFPAWYLF